MLEVGDFCPTCGHLGSDSGSGSVFAFVGGRPLVTDGLAFVLDFGTGLWLGTLFSSFGAPGPGCYAWSLCSDGNRGGAFQPGDGEAIKR